MSSDTENFQAEVEEKNPESENVESNLSNKDSPPPQASTETPAAVMSKSEKVEDEKKSENNEELVIKKRPHNEEEEDINARNEKYVKLEDNTKVVASHYNTLEEKGLTERSKSRIFFMRNFNNWIKSMVINEYITKIKNNLQLGAPLRVLDMCCGKGGDLLKWQKGNISHLICTDIAEVSIEQCETRYKTMAARSESGRKFNSNIFTAEFFACDSTLHRLRERYKDPSIELNLVSCQFAFHYCFESLPQAECMIRNAAECLRPGGYFLGTIPDANDIMRRCKLSDSGTFGNDVYQISFQCDTEKPPLFGAKYNFLLDGVVDCPEFLVHFPTLVKLAKKFGLELVAKERFDEFFNRMIGSGRGLIEKMQGLETYPPFPNNDLASSKDEDYSYVKEKLSSDGRNRHERNRRAGTLSKAEWEAASLYMIFVFRKMKTKWNSDGKPEYTN